MPLSACKRHCTLRVGGESKVAPLETAETREPRLARLANAKIAVVVEA